MVRAARDAAEYADEQVARMSVWSAIAVAGAFAALIATGCETESEPRPLDANSSCEERYQAVMNSPDVRENGSEGIAPRSEWIANCEAG